MNDDRRNDNHLPPNGDGAQALAVLERLPRAQASNQARQRTRLVFLHGADGAEPEAQRPQARRRPQRRWAALMMAAALGVMAIVWFGFTPEQEWVVLDTVNPGGISLASGDPLAPGDRLASGVISTGSESELEVQLGQQLRFRMLPGTALTLPRAPGRWFGRDRRLPLTSGEIYGTSGGRQLDFPLTFATGELQAQLTGTTFAVFRTDTASCVCLWRGGIAVQPLVGPDAPITLEVERRVWIFKDGRPPEILPLSGMEQMKLQMMHEAGLAEPPGQDQ